MLQNEKARKKVFGNTLRHKFEEEKCLTNVSKSVRLLDDQLKKSTRCLLKIFRGLKEF